MGRSVCHGHSDQKTIMATWYFFKSRSFTMNAKKTTLTAAILLGISSIASANPPGVPSIYLPAGPATPELNMTNMRTVEKAAFALEEAMMQATEAHIYVNGCEEISVPVSIYAHDPSKSYYIKTNGLNGVKLVATPRTNVKGFGQHYDIEQPVLGYLDGSEVYKVRGRYTFNDKNNMMVNEKTQVDVKSQLGGVDTYYSTVIKDFYHGDTYDTAGNFYEIYDYGLQSLSKFGYPVNKWWQQSKAIRDNGQEACTVFQKDRLVGVSACRIVIATEGVSQPGYFYQTGTLTVSPITPDTANTEMNNCSISPSVPVDPPFEF